jgi:FAD:protein FMN transferase
LIFALTESMDDTRHFFALGSNCALRFCDADRAIADNAAAAAMEEIGRIEARFSRYRPDSELSRINAAAMRGGTVDLDEETAGLIDYAFACYGKSDGLFDISSGLLRKAWDFSSGRIPSDDEIAALLPRIGLDKVGWDKPHLTFQVRGMELDFGGIGKEYAADRAAGVCKAIGIRHGLVDLGGDIRSVGPRPGGQPWRIGIRHPRNPLRAMASIELVDGAIATSGDYERFIEIEGRRYCHILDPRTGWPVRGLSSVSVMTAECLAAGSLATIALLKGRDGIRWLHALGLSYIFMDNEGRLGGNAKH